MRDSVIAIAIAAALGGIGWLATMVIDRQVAMTDVIAEMQAVDERQKAHIRALERAVFRHGDSSRGDGTVHR
jgi:hypothetical protein